MIDYRPFHNADPPKLLELWHACRLGRGAARGFNCYAFDSLNLSQPYFDPPGLIVACDGNRPVGFVHAGFGANDSESALCPARGVICVVMVRPEYRRQGIGRELVRRAEHYLRSAGSTDIWAGPAEPRDPFYFGMYGGCQPTGFLESDENARPFFQALGYSPHQRRTVFQRDITEPRDPVNFRLVNIRRQMQLTMADQPPQPSWWWMARLGRLDSLRFQLTPKSGGEPVAAVTIVGLDLYLETWRARAVGLTELFVPDPLRRKGYGQALLVEVARRLRQEMITLLDASVAESDIVSCDLVKSAGFIPVDTGVVYRRTLEEA